MLDTYNASNGEAVFMTCGSWVDKDQLKALAVKCPSGLSCLETGKCVDRCMCKIERAVGGNILFIKDDGFTFSCPYKVAFGFSHFCSCPVRSLIFKHENRTQTDKEASASPIPG